MLEKGRRRQHDVRVARCVRHHLLRNNGKEIVARQTFDNPVLVGHRRHRIAVEDEESENRGIGRFIQDDRELRHVDDAGVPRRSVPNLRIVHPASAAIAEREAAPALAELSKERRNGHYGRDRLPTILISLETPAAAEQRS